MSTITFKSITDQIPVISERSNYWFVRTEGGRYYKDFIESGVIAIGYNEVPYSSIIASRTNDGYDYRILSGIIRDLFKQKERRPNLAASQILKFTYDIKKGDIVLIPTYNSHKITWGRVAESPLITLDLSSDNCPYLKRKKVIWGDTILRDNLDPFLYKLMFTRHTINNANGYAEYIDKLTNSFYIKGDQAYLVLDVKTKNKIGAKELFQLSTVFDLLEEYSKDKQLGIDTSDISIKLNVQSPGIITFTGAITALTIIGVMLSFIVGADFSIENNVVGKVNIKTPGIIKAIQDFLDANEKRKIKRKILKKTLNDLNIQNPQDLSDVMKKLLE